MKGKMENPFAKIPRKLETESGDAPDRGEDSKPALSVKEQKRAALSEQYSGMVTEVLTQLRDAGYPRASVKSYRCYWIIKFSIDYKFMNASAGLIETVVEVSLKTDSKITPTHFLCRVLIDAPRWMNCFMIDEIRKKQKSGLSREELIRTLRGLVSLGASYSNFQREDTAR